MSNWFEDNPTKSVLLHTLVVATATWAIFTFVFDENKVKLHEAKVARAESETKEVNARNLVLVTRVEYLTKENEQLHRWLESEPKTIPYYENTLLSLNQKVLELEKALSIAKNKPQDIIDSGWLQKELDKYNSVQQKPVMASVYDPVTNIVIGADRILYEGTTDLIITLPDGQIIKKQSASPGDSWDYEYKGIRYRLVLDSTNWSTQTYGTRVFELGKPGTLKE